MSTTPDFLIIGAGLAGSLLATQLGRAGHRVELHERRGDPRIKGAEAGRSINLALSERGLHALDRVGLRERILQMAVPMRGRMIHSPTGALTFQPYGTRVQAINSVNRGDLNIALLDAAAAEPTVRLAFNRRCQDVDLDTGTVSFLDTRTGATDRVEAATIVGADGAFSAVRSAMQRRDRFEYAQSYLAHGYKELYIPPAEGGGFRLSPDALHIWPRGGFMMIALPNPDGSFTVTIFWAFEGPNSFARVRTGEDARRFFAEVYPDAVPLMPTLAEDFDANPTGSLVTVRCAPWHWGSRAVLVGDACHAVVPFYGQGANAAFEDCVVLAECLARPGAAREDALAEYQQRRKVHADTLADLAIENFLEMRDRVASPLFRLRKRTEKVLHALLPGWYLPLYTMVSFTRIPYAEAVRRARRQDRMVLAAALVLLALAAGLVWAR